MNLALIGYGRMGHEIEEIAVKRGHLIKLIVDIDNSGDLHPGNLKIVDAAIVFSSPASAFENISVCLESGIPVVSGTTGWIRDHKRAEELCLKNDTSFIHSSNFSIGVNLLFRLNSELAGLMKKYPGYRVAIEEIHHTGKLDAPSGTAISLADGIMVRNEEYSGWCFENEKSEGKIPIKAIREGMVPGTHTVTWDSEIDTLSLRHEARNRKGFALGAVIAAEFIHTRKGIFTMNDVMGF